MTLLRKYNRFPDVSDLFDNFMLNHGSNFFPNSRNVSVPAVNIREHENSYQIDVAAPGLEKSDFNIQVEDEMLNISVSKESSSEETKANYSKREFSYNSFVRSFTLPETADSEAIKANYKDGVLVIEIPKKEEAKAKEPRKISID